MGTSVCLAPIVELPWGGILGLLLALVGKAFTNTHLLRMREAHHPQKMGFGDLWLSSEWGRGQRVQIAVVG